MTVPVQNSRRVIIASGGWSNPLDHDFPLENAAHLRVYADGVLLVGGVDYSVSGVGDPAGYEVTITVPGDWSPDFWALEVEYPINQPSDVDQGGRFGKLFEDALDRLARGMQTLDDRTKRTPKLAATLPLDVDVTIEAPRSNSVIGWNVDGTGFENKGSVPDIERVASISSEIVAVAAVADDIPAVAGDAANIATVAAIAAEIAALGPVSAQVVIAAGIASDITAVAADAANISTVAGIASDIELVTQNIAAIQNAPQAALDAADARDAAQGYASAASGSATTAGGAATAAGNARDEASGYAVDAEGFRDAAQGYANSAGNSASAASTSAGDAAGFKNDAETAQDFAYQWSSAAEDTPVDDGDHAGYSAFHWSKKAEAAAGGGVTSVSEGVGVTVDNSDPKNPVVGLSTAAQSSLGKAESALQPSDASAFATAAQGDLADSALQPSDASAFATAAQGDAADAALPRSGGTMTGALTLAGEPSADLEAATKKYVDDNSGGGRHYEVITSSGTWNKPTGFPADARVRIEAWGAGGGGANELFRCGGAGGGYDMVDMRLGDLPSTVPVLIAAGGISSGARQGGDTSFGEFVTAFGGSGAANDGASCGGGGNLSAGTTSAAGSGKTGTAYDQGGYGATAAARRGFWGGGAGRDGDGGESTYGGGGGSSSDQTSTGGPSVFGGDGGGPGVDGSIPAGGGGALANGARGEVRILIY